MGRRPLVWVDELDLWLPQADAEPSTRSAEDEYFDSADSFGWGDALKVLTPKQRFVIERRWGLTDGIKYTLREIAVVMGVRFQTVWEHELVALKRLGRLYPDKHPDKSPYSG